MSHVSDGDLRRLFDEPDRVIAETADHASTCRTCRNRYLSIAADAGAVGDLLSVAEPQVNNTVALVRVRQRIAASNTDTRHWYDGYERYTTMFPLSPRRLLKPAAGLAAAAAVVVALAVTPAGTWAQGILTIFEPKQVAAVPINLSDLRTLPHLDDYGTVTQIRRAPMAQAESAAASSAATGLTVLTPSTLPSTVPTTVLFAVMPDSTASFTFRAEKAHEAAARKGTQMPPMPPNIDGSTLTMNAGPGVVAYYGDVPKDGAEPTSPIKALAKPQVDSARGVVERGRAPDFSVGMPALVIAQVKAPVVTSIGATAAQIEQYLLAQPGVSPGLASAIKSIGDPTATLPIPIPVDRASSHPVTVQGTSGLALSDATGVGTIVWQKNGVIYGVAGTSSEQQLLAIANSLH